jgi:hypothetical protein
VTKIAEPLSSSIKVRLCFSQIASKRGMSSGELSIIPLAPRWR